MNNYNVTNGVVPNHNNPNPFNQSDANGATIRQPVTAPNNMQVEIKYKLIGAYKVHMNRSSNISLDVTIILFVFSVRFWEAEENDNSDYSDFCKLTISHTKALLLSCILFFTLVFIS